MPKFEPWSAFNLFAWRAPQPAGGASVWRDRPLASERLTAEKLGEARDVTSERDHCNIYSDNFHNSAARPYWPRFLRLILSGLLLFALTPSLSLHSRSVLAAEEVPNSEVHVAVRQGLLTLAVRDAPLADVLEAIGDEAGFEVTINGDLDVPVTTALEGVPVDDAVRELVGNISMVMIHAPSRGNAEPRALAEVRIYGAPSARVVPKTRILPGALDQSFLRDLAQQSDPSARAKKVRKLTLERGEAAAEVLAAVLTREEDETVRLETVDALAKLASKPGATRSPAALVTALADDVPSVRARAVHALSKVSGAGVVDSVAETLSRDPDARIRRMAAWTLGKLRTDSARSALEVAAEVDPEATVRQEANSALQRWED